MSFVFIRVSIRGSLSMGIMSKIHQTVPEGQYYKPKRISGKPHNRQDELRSYRENIDFANDKIIECALKKDIEGIELWNRIIDDAQAKISAIITQEDGHTYKQYGNYTNMGNAAIQAADKAVDIGGKIVKLGTVSSIGSKVVSGGQFSAIA